VPVLYAYIIYEAIHPGGAEVLYIICLDGIGKNIAPGIINAAKYITGIDTDREILDLIGGTNVNLVQ
jgi:hypothetical protein